MAPGRPRRVQAAPPQSQNTQNEHQDQQEFPALFIDPMMGTPLPIYVDKDVEDRENVVRLITVSIGLTSTHGDRAHGIHQPGCSNHYGRPKN